MFYNLLKGVFFYGHYYPSPAQQSTPESTPGYPHRIGIYIILLQKLNLGGGVQPAMRRLSS